MTSRKATTLSSIQSHMLENATDYLERSIKSYHDKDLKYSLLFLWSGLLVLMKVRLFEVNPCFIFSSLNDIVEIDKESKSPQYKKFDCSGNKKTVDFKEILERMAIIDPRSSVFKYKEALIRIQRTRNRVEHFIDDYTEEEYLSSLNAALPFINDIVEDELKLDIHSLFSNWDQFLEIESIYIDRKEKMEIELGDRKYCEARDGDSFASADCGRCSKGKMISSDDEHLRCSICGYTTPFIVCSRCGATLSQDELSQFNYDTGICDDCFQDICDSSP